MTTRQPTSKSFFVHLKEALEHWREPAWLGDNSPLATPYFLGERLHGRTPTASERGITLQAELSAVLQTLWRAELPANATAMVAAVAEEEAAHGRGDRYDCLILELNYYKAIFRPAPKNQAEIYNDILHISRPTHDRHLAQAVERFGTLLLHRLRPALRPEQPPFVTTLVGREELQAQVQAKLQAGQTVSLTGAGGVGKSTLAAALTEAWPTPAIFWFTFRLTLNDQLDSLIFALGHFLHSHGASTLWHQLIADGGRLQDHQLALGLVRTDLAALGQRPLLCFDEMDVLRPVTPDQPVARHVQLLEFLDALRGAAPLLLIGQRAFWESDQLYHLEGLTAAHVATLLAGFAIRHTAEDLARLHFYSGGNPRLINLCVALYQAEGAATLQSILDQLPTTPTLLPLWHRLARRLPLNERQLLQQLAVFRTAAPADVWQGAPGAEGVALAQLIERRLVVADQQGGITLLPALREVIYGELAVETQEQYHAQAAQIRAERGEYTAAAYHLHQAGQAEAAITLWHAHQAEEINRGQASSALVIFEAISLRRLSTKSQKLLRLIRAELYQLLGRPDAVVTTLEPLTWSPEESEQVDAALLLGKALERQGRTDAAQQSYQNAIKVATALLSKMVRLHFQRSMLSIHERDLETAWREVNQARYWAETIAGTVHDQSGAFAPAHAHYSAALAIAQAENDQSGVATAYFNLGNLAMRQQAVDDAIAYYNQALAIHQAIGDRVAVEIARSGLVTAYMQATRYREAVTAGQTALHFFQTMGHSYWTAINASNLAEAYAELDELVAAESKAQLVLEQEEPQSHPYALFTLGRVRAKQEQWQDAALYMEQARAVAALNGDRFLLAYCWEELGKIQQAMGQAARGIEALRQAYQGFEALGIRTKVAELAARLGELDA